MIKDELRDDALGVFPDKYPDEDDVIGWLEIYEGDFLFGSTAAMAKEQIKQLNAERDQWQKDCRTYYDTMRKREDQIVILQAERDRLRDLLKEAGRKMQFMLDNSEWYAPEETIDKIIEALKGEGNVLTYNRRD